MSSTTDKINGKIKQTVGILTNDKELEIKGKVQETTGKVKSNLKHTLDKITKKITDKE